MCIRDRTCSLALIIGGVFLIAVGTIKATIPVTYLATVAVISLLTGHDPLVQLLSGGLLLGAFFMATDVYKRQVLPSSFRRI